MNVDSDLEFYVYWFSEKQIATVIVPSTNEDPEFGFKFATDNLYRRVFIKNVKKKSCASSIFKTTKSFNNNMRGAFLTHINNNPVFSEADAVAQLKTLQDQGVEKFSITFAPERPITGKKLKRAIDDYHYFVPGTTKKVKGNHFEEPATDMDAVDDGSTRYHVGTIVYKVFAKTEYKGTVTGYDPSRKLYHVIYMKMMILRTTITMKYVISRSVLSQCQKDTANQRR